MTNDLQLLLDRLMFLRLCGSVINAHIEHRKTFNDWFPKGPLDQREYNDQSDENGRTFRAMEAGVCCAFDLCSTAGTDRAAIAAFIEVNATAIEKLFASYYLLNDPELPMIALGPLAVVLEQMQDHVMPPEDLRAVYSEVRRIYALNGHEHITQDERARAEAVPMLEALRAAGLFPNDAAQAA